MVPRSQRWRDKGKPAERQGRKATGPSGQPGYRTSSIRHGTSSAGQTGTRFPTRLDGDLGLKLDFPPRPRSGPRPGAGAISPSSRPGSQRTPTMPTSTKRKHLSTRQPNWSCSPLGGRRGPGVRPCQNRTPDAVHASGGNRVAPRDLGVGPGGEGHRESRPSRSRLSATTRKVVAFATNGEQAVRFLWGLGCAGLEGGDVRPLERWGQDRESHFPLSLPTETDQIAMGSAAAT